MGIALSREVGLETSYFIQSLEKDSIRIRSRFCAYFKSYFAYVNQNDPFYDAKTNMVRHKSLLDPSDVDQYSWVNLEFRGTISSYIQDIFDVKIWSSLDWLISPILPTKGYATSLNDALFLFMSISSKNWV